MPRSPRPGPILIAWLGAMFLADEAPVRGDEPSPQRQAELRQLVEKRRQKRQSRGVAAAVGAVVPHPMPPALLIRQTPRVHGEVEDLLRLLRGG